MGYWDILRRRMMGGGAMDYVRDGLVFHLDGIDRGTTDTTKWVDLVGGQEFVTADGNAATFGDNHLITPCIMECVNYNVLAPYENETFEIVFTYTTNENDQIFRSKNKTIAPFGLGIGKYHSYFLLSNAWGRQNSVLASNISLNDNHTFSFKFRETSYLDGQAITLGKLDYYYGRVDAADLGYMPGKIYCIRQYNRKLTAEEMLHNQRVDNQRFNLGLTI